VIGKLFFPADHSMLSLAAVYASFGVTLLMRPLGSAMFGAYADTHGRKRAIIMATPSAAFEEWGWRCMFFTGSQIPGSGGSARLQKMVGITRTKDIVMRSRRIPGQQAYDWGVATECVPDAELEAATDRLVDELRAFSPIAQRTAQKLLNDTEDWPLSIAIELEGHCYSRLRASSDSREGVEAFHGKRKPQFKGN